MTEKSLIDIETKIAYQEHLITELNSVVFEQQKAIDSLERKVQLLIDRVVELSKNVNQPVGGDEKPPHY